MAKISILMLYRRIFDTKAFRRKSLVVGVICLVWCMLAVCIDIFQCRPFNAAFDHELLFTYHCIDLQWFYWGITACSVGLDVVILCLPIYEVWMLKLSKQKKIMLSGIFLLGGM